MVRKWLGSCAGEWVGRGRPLPRLGRVADAELGVPGSMPDGEIVVSKGEKFMTLPPPKSI